MHKGLSMAHHNVSPAHARRCETRLAASCADGEQRRWQEVGWVYCAPSFQNPSPASMGLPPSLSLGRQPPVMPLPELCLTLPPGTWQQTLGEEGICLVSPVPVFPFPVHSRPSPSRSATCMQSESAPSSELPELCRAKPASGY